MGLGVLDGIATAVQRLPRSLVRTVEAVSEVLLVPLQVIVVSASSAALVPVPALSRGSRRRRCDGPYRR